LVAIALALVATGRRFTTAPVDQPVTRTVIPLPAGYELPEHWASLDLSPDGKLVAFVAQPTSSHSSGGATKLFLRALDELDAKPIVDTEGARLPFFSHDGQWVGFDLPGGGADGLMKVPVSGGAPVSIADAGAHSGTSWGPEGRIVYTRSNASGLSSVSAEGGKVESLTDIDRAQGEKSHRWAEVLPGGKAVVYTLISDDILTTDDASIVVLLLETGESHVLIEGGMYARYSATGHLVYARDASLLAVPFDLNALELSGTPVPVLESVATFPSTGAALFAISSNGSLLYAPGGELGTDRRVLLVDRDGETQPLIDTPRMFGEPRLSPDGSSLAMQIDGANISLWAYDISHGTLMRLTSRFDNASPVWAPTGDRLAYLSARDFPHHIYSTGLDGTGEAEWLTTSDYHQRPSSWSSDGKFLAYVERGDIWVLSLEEERKSQPYLQTDFQERRPVFSPNSKWLTYESDESGRFEVYVRAFPEPGRRWQVSTGGGTRPRWSRNGDDLFYRDGARMMVVEVNADADLRLGTPKMLFERESARGTFDVMLDGQRFVMVDNSQAVPLPTQLVLVQNWAEELKRLVPAN
jgi:serine/threonine-protein kinase